MSVAVSHGFERHEAAACLERLAAAYGCEPHQLSVEECGDLLLQALAEERLHPGTPFVRPALPRPPAASQPPLESHTLRPHVPQRTKRATLGGVSKLSALDWVVLAALPPLACLILLTSPFGRAAFLRFIHALCASVAGGTGWAHAASVPAAFRAAAVGDAAALGAALTSAGQPQAPHLVLAPLNIPLLSASPLAAAVVGHHLTCLPPLLRSGAHIQDGISLLGGALGVVSPLALTLVAGDAAGATALLGAGADGSSCGTVLGRQLQCSFVAQAAPRGPQRDAVTQLVASWEAAQPKKKWRRESSSFGASSATSSHAPGSTHQQHHSPHSPGSESRSVVAAAARAAAEAVRAAQRAADAAGAAAAGREDEARLAEAHAARLAAEAAEAALEAAVEEGVGGDDL